MTRRLDLNCDLGEGAPHDAVLMPLLTSANLAAGGHAGDAVTLRAGVALARQHGVAIGAHPGHEDRPGFGRIERPVSPAEAARLVDTQVARVAAEAGEALRHVKLHGALYNQVSRDAALAAAVADLLTRRWPGLVLFALAGSELVRAARARGLRVAEEVFADRTYLADGRLTPRGRPDARVTDPAGAARRIGRLLVEGVVPSVDGTDLALNADTVCLHGDTDDAPAYAAALRDELVRLGIRLVSASAEPEELRR